MASREYKAIVHVKKQKQQPLGMVKSAGNSKAQGKGSSDPVPAPSYFLTLLLTIRG